MGFIGFNSQRYKWPKGLGRGKSRSGQASFVLVGLVEVRQGKQNSMGFVERKMNVTRVTKDATLDDLSSQDYRTMFDELRHDGPNPEKPISLDKFIALINSKYSKALWSRYDHGEIELNRTQRSELRIAYNRPPLPPTVAEATAQASPDASVWFVDNGEGAPETIIMLTGHDPVMLSINGSVSVVQDMPAAPRGEPASPPRKRWRIDVTETQNARTAALGVAAQDVYERGLQAMENEL